MRVGGLKNQDRQTQFFDPEHTLSNKKGTAKAWRREHDAQTGKRKRKYKKATYKIFFDRMEEGTLRVDIETGIVYTMCRIKKDWRPLCVTGDDANPDKSYAFITVYHKGACRKITISRLVWMVANAEEDIPKGCTIDHEDGNIHNYNYRNLVLVSKEYNQAKRNNDLDEYLEDF